MSRTAARFARRVAGAAVALAVVGACSSGGGSGGDGVLDPQGSGLILIDCWHDVAYELDADTGEKGRKGQLFAKPDSTVSPTDDCYGASRRNGPGMSGLNADGSKRGATKSFADDGARHVGYIDVGTGKFTDLSTRLKLDAFGELTDEGSGADDFAGPIKDSLIGFGTDGRFYLERAASVFSAAGPDFKAFSKHEAEPVLGVRFAPGGRLAVSDVGAPVLIEVSANAPALGPYQGGDDRYLGEDARYAPLVFPDDANGELPGYCEAISWIDATHLLCDGNNGAPGIIDFTEPTLASAADYAKSRGCGYCYGREYVWVMGEDAYRTLVPKTQRELSGFAIEPGTGKVLFLATDGDDVRLYAVGSSRGATPEVRGEFSLGDDAPPGLDYLTLRFR